MPSNTVSISELRTLMGRPCSFLGCCCCVFVLKQKRILRHRSIFYRHFFRSASSDNEFEIGCLKELDYQLGFGKEVSFLAHA